MAGHFPIEMLVCAWCDAVISRWLALAGRPEEVSHGMCKRCRDARLAAPATAYAASSWAPAR